ncbi:T9SS type A sorting domain-containing protein [Draconibacterium mangrovi]|uniref:T9SS type A sorting domain-containing protein n=1 Tax=Draconibacterium mangrovi TaxID=2697469 RepID=UPI0013D501D7|nr:T9SS type A sorting domain-containing protein [Draconibacterium mangrovi]
MVQKTIVLLLLNLAVFILYAHEMQDDFGKVDSASVYEYRLSKDIITSHIKNNAVVLQTKDHLSKTNFLHQFKLPIKSGDANSANLWTLDSIVAREMNEISGQTENVSRQTLSTSNNGQTLITKDYKWKNDDGHWLISSANYYFFGNEGRLDSVEFQEYVTINYRMFTKKYYTYEGGLLATEWSKEKFDEYDDWEKVSRLQYSYDSLNSLKQVNTMKWDQFYDRWSTFEILEYNYDSLGNISEEIAYDYDSYEMVKSKKYEIVYAYNEQNLLSDITEYVEGWGEDNFIPDRKLSYDYDGLMNLTTETLYSWDYDLDNWLEVTCKRHFDQISETLVHEVQVQNWDNEWIDANNTKYFSENAIAPGELENREFIMSFLPMLVYNTQVVDKLESTSFSGGEWLESGDVTYHFSQSIQVGINNETLAELKLFPNPAADYIRVQTPGLHQFECIVYDIWGRSLIHENISAEMKLNVSDLKPGYYLIEILESGKKISKGKFIKY